MCHAFTKRIDLPKSNAETPYSLALEAVGLCGASPVPDAGASPLLHVLGRACDECIRVGGVDLVARLADDVAVQVAHWLSERDSAYDESDEEERVDGSHDEKTEVGKGPVVADTDHDVEGRDAGLELSAMG
jgi:hypothetical protein